MATLPEGYRPTMDINIPIFVRLSDEIMTSECYMVIQPDGKINIYNWGNTKTIKAITGSATYIV